MAKLETKGVSTERTLPIEVLRIIVAREGDTSGEATDHFVRLGLTWSDVVSVAKTGTLVKKTRDQKRESRYVYAVTGRDLSGHLYMAGKVVSPGEEPYWYVITIHEATQ